MSKELKLKLSKISLKENDFKFGLELGNEAGYETNAKEYYTRALIGENSFRSKVRILPNVKDREKLGSVTMKSMIKSADCDFDPSDTKINQKVFEVCPLMAGTEICIESLEASFVADQLAQGANNYSDKGAFMNFFYQTLADTIQEELEYLTFRGDTEEASYTGDTAYLKTCDGLEKTLSESDDTIKSVSASTVNASNIIDKLKEARDLTPQAVRNKADYRLIVSRNVAEVYADKVALSSPLAFYNAGDKELKFQGIPLVIAEGASDDTILAGQLSNFSFATDLMSDEGNFTVVDFLKTTLDRKIGVRTDLKFGVDVIKADEVFVHIV